MFTRKLGCTLYFIFCKTHLLKAAFSISLSRDTIKTLKGNQVYAEGYHVSSRNIKQDYHSASSSVGLTRLAQDELKIYEALTNVQKCTGTTNGNEFPEIAQEYLADFEATSGVLMRNQRCENMSNEVAAVAGDLISAYRMIRRYRDYIQLNLLRTVSRKISSHCKPNFLEAIKNLLPNGTIGPFKRDFHLTMLAIIFTQLQLGWKPVDISQGTIREMELGPSLKAVHCVEIGVQAVASKFFPVGIEWLELALTKIQNGDDTMDYNLASSLLQLSITEHDKYWQPETSLYESHEAFYKSRLNDTTDNQEREWPRQLNCNGRFPDDKNYTDISWDVCTGKIQQTEAEKSKLFCWHETKVHPTWTFGPLKAELLGRHPFEVLQFHQVLQDSTLDSMKEYLGSHLGTTFTIHENEIFTTKMSLSEVVKIWNERMHKITERIAGLKAQNSPSLFGISYAPGGHMALHVDRSYSVAFQENIATMNYFLEEPKIGGETVFPASKVLAKPIKGSAILFYNLLQSSKYNVNGKHGSCPVVQGHKWIGTNWLDYDTQTDLKCDADENARMEYFVNGRSK